MNSIILMLTHPMCSPEVYNRESVTYPSDLVGIAGYISKLSSALLDKSSSGVLGAVTADTIVTTCVPRTSVTVRCRDNLDDTGISWNNLGTSGTSDAMNTQQVQFCGRNAECGPVVQRADYGDGSMFVVSFTVKRFDRIDHPSHMNIS
jgi:hypothetical protein